MTKVHVSDHALLRYIERKYGFCFDQFRSELESLVSGAAAAKAYSFTVGDLKFCLAPPTPDGSVTIKTVLLRSMKTKHLKKKPLKKNQDEKGTTP